MNQTAMEKLEVRLLDSETLIEDLFNDWSTLVEQDLEEGNEDVQRLHKRCCDYLGRYVLRKVQGANE